MLAKCPAVHDFTDQFPVAHLFDAQLDQAIREQDSIATVNFPRQGREGCANSCGIAEHLRRRNHKSLPCAKPHRPAPSKRPRTDFWSLEIRQNGDWLFMLAGGGADHSEGLRVLFVRSMRKV